MTQWNKRQVKNILGQTKAKEESKRVTLTDAFLDAITDWELKRSNPYFWKESASFLIETHGYVRTHALIPGHALKKQLDEKDEQIKSLKAENQGLKQKAELLEFKFNDCHETNLKYEKSIRAFEQEKDDQRKEDMLRSLLENKGKGTNTLTEPGSNETEEGKGK